MRRKAKWIFTIIAIIGFVVFGKMIPDDDLGARAMAVGLGIDCDDEGNIVTCAQILTSSGAEGQPSGTRVVEAKAELLSSAISKITEICGMSLTVTHCNVVILGEKLIDSGQAYQQIYTLLENTYVSDNAYVFVCEGTPKDIFTSSSAFGNNASQFLQQMITSYGIYDNIPYKMIRQIIVDYHNIGEATYMPYITKVPVKQEIPSSGAERESQSSGSGGGQNDDDYSFNLNNVQVLKEGKSVGVYGEDAAKAINYIMTKVDKGSDDFNLEKGTIGIFILNNDVKKDYNLETKTFSVKLKIGITVKDLRAASETDMEETFVHQLTDEEKALCENQIKSEIESFFKEMQDKDADVFEVRQAFYSKYGKQSETLELKDVKLKLEVELSVEK